MPLLWRIADKITKRMAGANTGHFQRFINYIGKKDPEQNPYSRLPADKNPIDDGHVNMICLGVSADSIA